MLQLWRNSAALNDLRRESCELDTALVAEAWREFVAGLSIAVFGISISAFTLLVALGGAIPIGPGRIGHDHRRPGHGKTRMVAMVHVSQRPVAVRRVAATDHPGDNERVVRRGW